MVLRFMSFPKWGVAFLYSLNVNWKKYKFIKLIDIWSKLQQSVLIFVTHILEIPRVSV